MLRDLVPYIIISVFRGETEIYHARYISGKPGDRVAGRTVLGEICSIYGEPLTQRAKAADVILCQTVSLGMEAGTPMIAYGELS